MPPKLPPHVNRVRNKIGRPYIYFQLGRGTKGAESRHRLPDDPTSHEFWAEYARLSGLPHDPVNTRSVAALVAAWHQSPEWEALAISTRVNWTRYSSRIIESWGALEVAGIEPKHLLALRDHYAKMPASQCAECQRE
jgi:hypothetical protein